MGKDNERELVDKTKKDTVSKSFWRDNVSWKIQGCC